MYKYKKIKNLINSNPSESFILIGDDTENDPSIYLQIKKEFPNQIESIYIRAIKNLQQPESITKFFTAFEVAAKEFELGRMSLQQTLSLGKDLLLLKEMKLLIPQFAYCPKSEDEFTEIAPLSTWTVYKALRIKILKYCSIQIKQD
ncbi:MAG: DUF2183 domain-containing protein [Ignavibacteriae bacterium]|nr:DUF2183 domain-containing protein [Ignavibacteriota bacterium]